jgi:hypothetical protein
VAPPSTIEFEERIGGLEESPATVSIQMNTKMNLVVLLKVGSDGYLFRSYLFNAKKKEPLDIKPSGRVILFLISNFYFHTDHSDKNAARLRHFLKGTLPQ